MSSGGTVPDDVKTFEEDKEQLMRKVVQLRKRYPKKCSHLLSKKLKMEHFMLENIKVILAEDQQDEAESENEIPVHHNVDHSFLLSKIAALEEEADNISKVLVQIKSEKNCQVNIKCI